MRVLFLTGEFPPMQGGVGDCTNEIARALVALGAEVQVLTSTQAVSDQPSAVSDQQSVVSGQPSAVSGHPSSVSVLPIVKTWNWANLRVIARAIREFAPEIAHVQYQTGAFGMHPAIDFAPRLLKSHATKFVVTFHDLRVPYLFPKAGRVREWVTRELARASDAVIATNDEDHAQLLTLNLKLLTLIPIGSNILITESPNFQRDAWRAQLGVRDDETLLCYFGFLNESKGGETLIRALALVPHAKLLMIGGQVGASDPTNRAYLSHIQSLISNLQLSDRVLWTDYTPPEIVTANFRAADVCVLPYRDGASYRRGTLMAALAHGCAVVTTQVKRQKAKGKSMLPELDDGENCLLVPPDDPRALADAIQRAMASPGLRAKIGAGARELAQHFTWDKIAQQHFELYQRIANSE
jgi:glycosyltransferase involved in cell wall biosynthesis